MPKYNEIGEDDRFYFIWRAHETEPFHLLKYLNLYIEIGFDKNTNRLFIRRLLYPKETYKLEDVERIARDTVECPYCKVGVEVLMPDCTELCKYASTPNSDSDRTMSLVENLKSKRGTIGAIALHNVLGYFSPALSVGAGIGVAVIRAIAGIKSGGLSTKLKSPFFDGIIIGGLSQIGGMLSGKIKMENSSDIIRRLRAKLPMSSGSILDRIKSLIPKSNMSDPRLEVPKVSTPSTDILFGRRT